jgi:hypothetical protein
MLTNANHKFTLIARRYEGIPRRGKNAILQGFEGQNRFLRLAGAATLSKPEEIKSLVAAAQADPPRSTSAYQVGGSHAGVNFFSAGANNWNGVRFTRVRARTEMAAAVWKSCPLP